MAIHTEREFVQLSAFDAGEEVTSATTQIDGKVLGSERSTVNLN
ncbi:hypothetical protein SVI_1972 [Shewanella violacea DSS12]|uniref:Uncharacterized protein n=1 Tax=Shewanella violacea (strain JCM 10179 / CIP 106290 / LMG 19151 / DSS12) TaxID=637905 RepID=D4ZJU4_SHEVD|nr:hypothetical protein SVI_1972 [Shewanella violacea DSS12]